MYKWMKNKQYVILTYNLGDDVRSTTIKSYVQCVRITKHSDSEPMKCPVPHKKAQMVPLLAQVITSLANFSL